MFKDVNYYRIADIDVSISGAPKWLEFIESIRGFESFRVEEITTAEIQIVMSQTITRPTVNESTSVNVLKHEGFIHTFWSDSSMLLFEIEDGNNKVAILNQKGSKSVLVTPCEDAAVMRFALWVAFSMVSVPMGAIPIHSSTITHDGYALLSLGESGTGKSTHSRMWLEHIPGCELLNDDSPILRMREGQLYAYGSPWSGKLPCYKSESYPVRSIARIVRNRENRMNRAKGLHAIAAIYPSLPPMYAHDPSLTASMLGLCSDIVKSTPIYRLECRADGDAARTNYNEVFAPRVASEFN